MKLSKLSPKLIVAILIAFIFFISLLFRIILPYHQVFNDGWIKFTSIDAYFYQRVIDNTAYNFPHIMNFDPYFIYPGGRVLGDIFFPEWLIAGFAWLFGLGSPTQHTVDVVSVFFPALFAALTVIPVYFIGKTLFNRWVGVIAAGLMAVLPGEYLGRTILGLTDTPAAETLLTTTFLCFTILAVKTARERELTLDDLLRRNWPKCLRPIIFSLLAGLFLGLYLLSWQGALLFVFIFALYLVIQAVRDHLVQRSVDHLGIVGVITFLVALIIFFGYSPGAFYTVSLMLALLIPAGLLVLSRVMTHWKLRPLYYPVALVVAGGIAMGVFYLINPDLFTSLFSRFDIFAPSGATGQTTIELQPFLDPTNTGTFTTSIAWGNFTASFFLGPWWVILGIVLAGFAGLFCRYYLRGSTVVSLFVSLISFLVVACVLAGFSFSSGNIDQVTAFPGLALISLGILIYLFVKKEGAGENYLSFSFWVVVILAIIMAVLLLAGYGHRILSFIPLVVIFAVLFLPGGGQKNWLLFIIWTLVILALTLPSRRYAYYLVVNIALLSAYLSWQIIWLAGVKHLTVKTGPAPVPVRDVKAKARKKDTRRERAGTSTYVISTVLAGLMVFFLAYLPNIALAKDTTTREEASFAPSDAWMASLDWLRSNTPEPFGDPEAYYRQYVQPPGETFAYPPTAYGVTSWWDYGYWITQIAHRLPSANPSQDPTPIIKVANLFLSDNADTARDLMAEMESSYVVLDNLIIGGKFWAVATWAERPLEKYYEEDFAVIIEGQGRQVRFYYPSYYETLMVRLYNFNGEAVIDERPVVITWVDRVDTQGTPYREVTEYPDFDTYQEALDYLNSLGEGNHAIVGINPFMSPIPLEAVPDFRLIHSSEQGTSVSGVGFVPEIKIFEYTGP